jgi:hypothetical protein
MIKHKKMNYNNNLNLNGVVSRKKNRKEGSGAHAP